MTRGPSLDVDPPRGGGHTQVTLLSRPRGGIPDVTDSVSGFRSALDDLSAGTGPLAVDAERASTYRYSHGDYLIQLRRTGSQTYLLDVPALLRRGVRFSQLSERLPGVEWILHDGSQDLPSFKELGIRVDALFDTQLAARMLGLSHPGLAHCTEYFLGLSLAKEHAAADWSYRPLPLDWRNYAALDVELLIQLRDAMRRDLKAQGKLDWAREEFHHILKRGMEEKKPDPEPWRHVSRITRLGSDRRALGVVRSLWTVRDRLARKLDICPLLLLRDSDIVEAARRKPRTEEQYARLPGLAQRVEIQTGTAQDAMFARYIPLQEKVDPAVWREAIQKALSLPRRKLPHPSAPQERVGTAVPRSMKFWRIHQPRRYARLMAMRRALAAISQDVRVPVDLLIRPHLVRAICWEGVPGGKIRAYLTARGARPWQVSLVSSSLTGISM